jgi:hypothetical protein
MMDILTYNYHSFYIPYIILIKPDPEDYTVFIREQLEHFAGFIPPTEYA